MGRKESNQTNKQEADKKTFGQHYYGKVLKENQ